MKCKNCGKKENMKIIQANMGYCPECKEKKMGKGVVEYEGNVKEYKPKWIKNQN